MGGVNEPRLFPPVEPRRNSSEEARFLAGEFEEGVLLRPNPNSPTPPELFFFADSRLGPDFLTFLGVKGDEGFFFASLA